VNSEENLGPKLLKRIRALFLSQIDAYERLITLMNLQISALESREIDVFINRFPLEEGLFSELASIDRVITPLLMQLKDLSLQDGDDIAEVRRRVHGVHGDAKIAHEKCETLLSEITGELKNRIPMRKRVSRFAGGRRAQGGQYVDLSV